MNKLFALLLVAGMAGFTACGPSAEEQDTQSTDEKVDEIFDEMGSDAEEVGDDIEDAAEEVEEEIEEAGEEMEEEVEGEEPKEMSEEN